MNVLHLHWNSVNLHMNWKVPNSDKHLQSEYMSSAVSFVVSSL